MKESYLETIRLIERLHRRFLDVIKTELDRLGVEDINNVQTLILFNINEEQLTVGELTARGYYLGSNVSYNVKKMVEHDYLEQERSPHDRRATHLRCSPKGLEVCRQLDALFAAHAEDLGSNGLGADNIAAANDALLRLEGFWAAARLGARPGYTTAA